MNNYTKDPSEMEAKLLQAITGLNGAVFENVYVTGQQTHIVIHMECGMWDAYRFRP